MIWIKIGKELITSDEVRELASLLDIQEACPFKSTELTIHGNHADIDVKVDEMGDIELTRWCGNKEIDHEQLKKELGIK